MRRVPGALPQADMSSPFRAVDPQYAIHDPQSFCALKGQDRSAQGNALGKRPPAKRPVGAQQGRTRLRGLPLVAFAAALLAIGAAPAFAADDASDTVVLGVEGNETFEFYKGEGYAPANTPAAALALFNTTTNAKYTRLLILKNAATNDATVIGEWAWPSMTTPPGNLTKIEGGSPEKPYDIKLLGSGVGMFQFTDVGETGSPFIISGVTIHGASSAVIADGDSAVELECCYIQENTSHGVVVTGSATVKMTNCIFAVNTDGVRVESSTGAPSATLTHCSAISNHGKGLTAGDNSNVTSTNSLFYYNEQGGVFASATATLILDHNNSYDNALGLNYDPVAAAGAIGTDNFSESVIFVASNLPFHGKLDLLLNLGLNKGVGTDVFIDFESDGRADLPYIGADEVVLDPTIGSWTRCEVYVEPIGRRGADVLINYSGTSLDLNTSLCLIPDGVDVNDLAHDINVPLEGGDGIYWGRVPAINWDLGDGYIADSDNARLVLRLPGGILGDDIGADEGHIFGQAIDGHKGIVIDTIPPVVNLDYYTTDMLVAWGAGPAAGFGAAGVPFASAPPFPYPAIGGFPQMTGPAASASRAVFTPAPPEPPLFLYNVGSVANGYNELLPEHWLYLTIQATFIDPDVYTAKQLPPDGFTRTPSGFNSVVLGTETGAAAHYLSDAPLAEGVPAAWIVSGSPSPLTNAAATAQFSCNAGAGTGMTATWDVAIPVVGVAGPLVDRLELLGDFIAQDKAANYAATTDIDRSVVPPLRIVWLSGYGTRVDFRTRMYGAWPEVAWNLNDTKLGINRLNEANPRPIYSYNIWGARSYGMYNSDPIYEELTGWSLWDPENVLSASYFDQNINDNFGSPITDRWLIMVVAGCDEAGNVTPWDGYQWPFGSETPSLLFNGDGSLTLLNNNRGGRNWTRFFIPGKTTQIDTVLFANLFYLDDSGARKDLGPASIVSYPPPGVSLFAEFNARLLVNDPELWSGMHSVGVQVAGQENSRSIFRTPGFAYLETSGTDMVGFQLPFPDSASGGYLPPRLGDPSNVMTYTASAAAVVDIQTDYQLEDQTPATFSFKVVPGSVDEYLRSAGGQQPVKQFETR